MTPEPNSPSNPSRAHWRRARWIATFAPICVGLVVAGIAVHLVFLAAAGLWLVSLGCVLQVESVTSTRQQLAKAAWLLTAILSIFASAGLINVALG